MKTKVFVVSLGCSKNHCDLENMMGILVNHGYEITLSQPEADAILINTCGFIESAKEEAIEAILEAAAFKETGNLKALIVAGCLAQRYQNEILAQFPEVDAVVGVFNFEQIHEIISKSLQGTRGVYADRKRLQRNVAMPRIQVTPFYTAYLKISEGCDNRCTYCAIPGIRGPYESRPMEELVEEAKELAENGVKELIIVAQDTTRYGLDLYREIRLIPLLSELEKIEGLRWIRLHYLYPEMVTHDLISYIAKSEKVLPYFDIPIQHINDGILKLMNRRSDKNTIQNTLNAIRNTIPHATIRTTVIAGFPGETSEEFEELLSFLADFSFDRLGAFAFSKEEGTPAASMKNQVPKKTKIRRQMEIQKQQSKIMLAMNQKQIGRVFTVLTEGYDTQNQVYFGRTYQDSVDIDGTVIFPAPYPVEFGDFVEVKITGAKDYDLIGEMIS